MANPISPLGAIHTLISLPPVVAGLYGFFRYRGIDTSTRSGKLYLAGLALSVVTSFGLSTTGRFNAGHALGILALLAAFGGTLVPRLSFLGRLRPYLTAAALSFSFFLLLVPGINETLSRLPPSAPIASGIDSPIVRATLLAWVAILLVGLCAQVLNIYLTRKRGVVSGRADGAMLGVAK
jgi:hypothetical protein